jgi:probable rRNA maturation factor
MLPDTDPDSNGDAGEAGDSQAHAGSVFVADEQRDVELDVARWSRLASEVLAAEGADPDAQVAVVFVDAPSIAALNREFLGGSGPTDVLAFPIDDEAPQPGRRPDQGGRGPGSGSDEGDAPTLLGDVYVCPRVAARQARDRSIEVEDELALLVVHGLLHLLGSDHLDPDDAAAMRQRERELLAQFGELVSPLELVTRYPQIDVAGDDGSGR